MRDENFLSHNRERRGKKREREEEERNRGRGDERKRGGENFLPITHAGRRDEQRGGEREKRERERKLRRGYGGGKEAMPLLMTEFFSYRERERERDYSLSLSVIFFIFSFLITLFSIFFQLIIYLFSDKNIISQ